MLKSHIKLCSFTLGNSQVSFLIATYFLCCILIHILLHISQFVKIKINSELNSAQLLPESCKRFRYYNNEERHTEKYFWFYTIILHPKSRNYAIRHAPCFLFTILTCLLAFFLFFPIKASVRVPNPALSSSPCPLLL